MRISSIVVVAALQGIFAYAQDSNFSGIISASDNSVGTDQIVQSASAPASSTDGGAKGTRTGMPANSTAAPGSEPTDGGSTAASGSESTGQHSTGTTGSESANGQSTSMSTSEPTSGESSLASSTSALSATTSDSNSEESTSTDDSGVAMITAYPMAGLLMGMGGAIVAAL